MAGVLDVGVRCVDLTSIHTSRPKEISFCVDVLWGAPHN